MTTQGKRLKAIRQVLNLTQEEMGIKLGISKQFYSNIETDRALLNNDKLVLLYKYYNVNLNYLIMGCGSMFNEALKTTDNDFKLKVREVLKQEGLIK